MRQRQGLLTGATQLVGLMGWPVGHSFSPAMHNAALAQLGLDWVYVPLPVREGDVGTAVAGLPALGFRGVNVTIPHKQAVIPFLSDIEAGAKAIGAVNTIVVQRAEEESRLHGYNSDWRGFLADLQANGVDVAGRDCLVLGAGGSARAVVYGLLQEGARVWLLARRLAQAEAILAQDLGAAGKLVVGSLAELPRVAADLYAPLIVNTTPLGMSPHVAGSVWPDELPFPAQAVLYDLVYNPLETRLMQQAQAAGCQALNGLGMLIQQGAVAFKLWTGQEPDVAVMRQALITQLPNYSIPQSPITQLPDPQSPITQSPP